MSSFSHDCRLYYNIINNVGFASRKKFRNDVSRCNAAFALELEQNKDNENKLPDSKEDGSGITFVSVRNPFKEQVSKIRNSKF